MLAYIFGINIRLTRWMTNLHDDLRMPFHDTVLEVEPFNITDCC